MGEHSGGICRFVKRAGSIQRKVRRAGEKDKQMVIRVGAGVARCERKGNRGMVGMSLEACES